MRSFPRLVSLLAAALTAWSAVPAAASDRPESQQEYWAQLDRRDWSAAIAAAEKLVAVARENIDEPLALAETLTLLGNAHLGAADYTSAEAAYGEALQLTEQHASGMSGKLVEPLRGMGYTLAASGRDADAIAFLDRSLIVGRRNFGLFEPGQKGVLRQLGVSLTKLGRLPEAERHLRYMLRIAERQYGKDDPRLSPVLCSLGAWYANAAEFGAARAHYAQALAIVSRKLGKSHIANVEPLRGLARTYTHELALSTQGIRINRDRALTDADGSSNDNQPLNPRRLSPDGEKALERALRIVESQSAPPLEAHVGTLIQLGDWRQIKDQADNALPLYRRAAALLAAAATAPKDSDAASEDEPPAPLSFPVRVYYATPWLATRNLSAPAESVDETFVQVEFTVTRNGQVADARIVDKNGTARQEADALEAIQDARFRPRFVDGEAVDTPGLTNREVFRTRKEEKEAVGG